MPEALAVVALDAGEGAGLGLVLLLVAPLSLELLVPGEGAEPPRTVLEAPEAAPTAPVDPRGPILLILLLLLLPQPLDLLFLLVIAS